ncbi:MAG: helix-turn-helix domain-containing protein [Saccharofermentanales bacterium]
MENYTTGKKFNISKIAEVSCYDKIDFRNIDIKGKSFLLLVITEGTAIFAIDGKEFTAIAPCFVCFDELHTPLLIKKHRLVCKSIFFHPMFLNMNMTFSLIRANGYYDIAHTHDLFLLKPFTDEKYVVPIITEYADKILEKYESMKKDLEDQTDWYWSCRARSYFMEMIIMLERLYGMHERDEITINEGNRVTTQNQKVKKSLLFIESHYSENIGLKDIIAASKSNHTSLGKLFMIETGQTPIEYLWGYRLKVAKKQLAFTDVPLKEVSNRCGFKTVFHFSRMFKDKVGNTPVEFRKNAVDERRKGIKT